MLLAQQLAWMVLLALLLTGMDSATIMPAIRVRTLLRPAGGPTHAAGSTSGAQSIELPLTVGTTALDGARTGELMREAVSSAFVQQQHQQQHQQHQHQQQQQQQQQFDQLPFTPPLPSANGATTPARLHSLDGVGADETLLAQASSTAFRTPKGIIKWKLIAARYVRSVGRHESRVVPCSVPGEWATCGPTARIASVPRCGQVRTYYLLLLLLSNHRRTGSRR